ncbi:MAG: hypothetical protein M0P72_05870 [Metallibacterium scheffleri]|jgi:hypothetical protein|uniref:hypothetical protein n=1 Tax=Metallibacterium scheffleri TaxID=993689 RepID=UPI0026EADBC8|nr:hypothetical protein [Metallibacterium scheffleri]MCK9366658.1 hypothetical protein [Metallibacterium scheffleri]
MRATLIVIGLLLALGGLWIGFGHGHYERTRTAASVGSLKLKATSEQSIPAPIGYGLLVIGVVLIGAGALRRR